MSKIFSKFIAVVLLFFFSERTTASNTPAPEVKDSLNLAGRLSLFYSPEDSPASLAFSYAQNDFAEERKFRQARLGGRWRLHTNFKLGLFLARTWGLRHDQDWITLNGRWHWRDTNDRDEDIAILEATSRSHASFLPGKDWVAEMRVNFENNMNNGQRTVKFRPGLTYFKFRKGELFYQTFLRFEAYVPLNYSQVSIYEKWLYTGVGFNLVNSMMLGLQYSLYELIWSQTDNFETRFSKSYESTEKGSQLMLFLNYSFR